MAKKIVVTIDGNSYLTNLTEITDAAALIQTVSGWRKTNRSGYGSSRRWSVESEDVEVTLSFADVDFDMTDKKEPAEAA